MIREGSVRYFVLVILVLLVALFGYTGYVLYPRFELPPTQGLGLLGLAAAAGVASFFSPCSFPLLLSVMGRGRREGTGRILRSGLMVAAGAATFLLVAGTVIALGGERLLAGVTFASPTGVVIRSTVGALLIFLGLIQAGVVSLSMHGASRLARPFVGETTVMRRREPMRRFLWFGFGYVLAGFG